MIQFINHFLKKSNKRGFVLTAILGTLFHFTFHWLGKNPLVGLFSAVNESTWEHMKLLFFPALIYFLIEYKKLGTTSRDLLAARTLGLLCGLAFIPTAFYTYSGIIGQNFTGADIAIFYISVFLTFCISTLFLRNPLHFTSTGAFLLLLILSALFIVFTFYPPHIQLFLDPVTFTYGL